MNKVKFEKQLELVKKSNCKSVLVTTGYNKKIVLSKQNFLGCCRANVENTIWFKPIDVK